MSDQDSGATARGSVARRFNLALAGLYLLAILISAPAIYWFTQRQVEAQARTELEMLVDMVASIKGYVAADLRPYFLKNGLFHTPGFSGIVATAKVAKNFHDKQPRYTIRSVSDNPLNPANLPKPAERELLSRFQANPALTGLTEAVTLDDQGVLVSAEPMVSKPGCLRCHGDPDQVPTEITSEYGRNSGYLYRVGDTVGMSVIGVPLADVKQLALERSLYGIGFLTLLFALIFATINQLVRRYLIAPLLTITDFAKSIAKGKLDQALVLQRDDEIGALARSVELLRRSFAQLMKRMGKSS